MLAIGEVAGRAGLRASAIRYYEEQGLLPRPRRRSGKRVYDVSVLDRLALIELSALTRCECPSLEDCGRALLATRAAP